MIMYPPLSHVSKVSTTHLEQLAHYLQDFVICCKVSVKKKHLFSFLLQATFFAAFSILFQNAFIQVKVSSSDVADFRQNTNLFFSRLFTWLPHRAYGKRKWMKSRSLWMRLKHFDVWCLKLPVYWSINWSNYEAYKNIIHICFKSTISIGPSSKV